MIFIARGENEPESLSSQATLNEAKAASDHYAHWREGDEGFGTFMRYREYDIQQALRALFHGKCAYCEKLIEKGSAEVEHYRPKGAIDGCGDHPGYWWLALKWSNLLPTCPGCNRGLKHHVVTPDMTVTEVEELQATPPRTLMGKATQFPVGASRLVAMQDDHLAEQPHLIDPTRTDPTPEMRWHHHANYSVVEGIGPDGAASIVGSATIRCVALNRLDLVQSRTVILNRLKLNRARIMEDLEADVAAEPEPASLVGHLRGALRRVEDMKRSCEPDQPFSAMAHAFVAAFEAELEAWVRANLPRQASVPATV